MYCPLCGAEYRPGFTVCSDCQVALVPDPPSAPSADASIDRLSTDTSFALLWSGSDARMHAEICDALDRQKIPKRTLRREDHIFGPAMRPEFEVYVPAGLRSAAREAVRQADPGVEDPRQPSDSQQLLDSGILEIPAEEGLLDEEGALSEEDERRDPLNFDPQDATVEVWSGKGADLAAMIASSLRENHIPYRRDPGESKSEITEAEIASDDAPVRLLVLPDDERRAKEIVREIIDAVPPE